MAAGSFNGEERAFCGRRGLFHGNDIFVEGLPAWHHPDLEPGVPRPDYLAATVGLSLVGTLPGIKGRDAGPGQVQARRRRAV